MPEPSADLLLLAELYLSLGYSVIPLLGDSAPDRPKAPALPWSAYQSRRASLAETRKWFTEQGFLGLGIVTGAISRLAVLDFDSPDLYQDFRAQHPDLAEHSVLQTRRGFHIYYQLPPHLRLPSRKTSGVDWLSEGCYVVARPTRINGVEYKAIKGGVPALLSQPDLARITVFLNQQAPAKPPEPIPTAPSENLPPQTLLPADLQAFYRAQVGAGRGRNQSLFNTSLIARDHGWTQPRVQAALAELHIQTGAFDHAHETDRQRSREALQTIQSAFSRPARPARALPSISPQLPTRARETFYALKLTCAVRVIESLREKGIQPGQAITRKQAHLLLKGIVGRDSVDNALHALTPTGFAVFEAEKAPSPLPPASKDAADDEKPTEFKKCFFEGAQKSGKMLRGRKASRYVMPSNAQICCRLGIRPSASDPLQSDDLTSARKTRQAAHREFIKRRPGQYPRDWLAKRLGVSLRTLHGYNHALEIQVEPIYDARCLSWTTLNEIPDFPLGAVFLQDEKGHRYPANRDLAARLLTQGRRLKLMRQRPNFYSLDPAPVMKAQVDQIQQEYKARQEQIEERVALEQAKTNERVPLPLSPAAQPRSALPPPEPHNLPLPAPVGANRSVRPETPSAKPVRPPTKRQVRQPLPNAAQEALAQRAYNFINGLTSDPGQRISQATARRCVLTYGAQAVERVLRLVMRRRNLHKPAGFFVTALRSEAKYGRR